MTDVTKRGTLSFHRHKSIPMRKYLVLGGLVITVLAACSKKKSEEEVRWLESTEKKETIVFKQFPPSGADTDTPPLRSLYLQFRKLPQDASYPNPSGLYLYESVAKDSIRFENSDQTCYFLVADDGKSFTIGRFFPVSGTQLPEKLVFVKQ